MGEEMDRFVIMKKRIVECQWYSPGWEHVGVHCIIPLALLYV